MKDQIELLIHKQLTGDITPAELEVLDQLLDESGSSIAQDISTIWEVSADYKPEVSFDSDVAFASMMSRISDSQSAASDVSTGDSVQEAKVVSIFSPRRLARVAAMMVFAVASYVVVQNVMPQTIEGGSNGSYAMLDDGSSVWLSPNSSLTVSSILFANRNVALDGKGFFDVARNEKHPFVIATDDVDIKVLGTSFTVDTKEDMVSVASGTVMVTSDVSKEEVIITKGDKVSLIDGMLQKSAVEEGDLNWMNPTLSFDNAPLDQVIKELALHFNVDIRYQGRSNLAECPFTATNLSDTSLEDVLAILRATYSMDIDTETAAPSIILSKVRCR